MFSLLTNLPILDLIGWAFEGEEHLHYWVGGGSHVEVVLPHPVLALEVPLHNCSNSSVLLWKSCSHADEIVARVKDNKSSVRDASRHKRTIVHDTDVCYWTRMSSLQHSDHLDRPPDHQIPLSVARDDFTGVGEGDADDVFWLLDLLGEESLSAHQDVPLNAPNVEVALTTGDEDVVPLLVEPDGQHPVRGGRGGGEQHRLDLLLLKLGPDRDVRLICPVHYRQLRAAFSGTDGERKSSHL